MNRVTARTHAMKLIYEWEMGGEGGEETRLNLLGATPGEEEYAYMERVFAGVKENIEQIDGLIEQCAVGWKPERIARVDLAILRLAAYEMLAGQTSQNVIINEAVELARLYSGEKSPQFVHGVLGSISRSLAQ